MAKRAQLTLNNLDDLLALEAQIDYSVCGFSLADERATRFAQQGAHDASPTYYFVLEQLFGQCTFDEHSHLLDVGCSTGRVLAHFVHAKLPGHATGVELDADLAATAQRWCVRYPQLSVVNSNVLDLDLGAYTHFYLFNPFSPGVLQRFIEQLEQQVTSSCTVMHMSDNGDTWHYVGRPGWTELASERIQHFRNSRGRKVEAYEDPQHYTIWRYEHE